MNLFFGLLFFQTFSNLSSFHSTQSFRNGLLQHWSPKAQVLDRKSAPAWALYGLLLFSGHVCLLCRDVFLGLQQGYLLYCVPSRLQGASLCLHGLLHRWPSPLMPAAPVPSPSSLSWCLWGCFPHICITALSHSCPVIFLSFFQMCYHRGTTSTTKNQFKKSLSDIGTATYPVSQKPPWQASQCNILPCELNTIFLNY